MGEPLKNLYLTKTSIPEFAEELLKADKTFDKQKFVDLIYDVQWEERELMDRMRHVTYCLYETLPKVYEKALAILYKIAGKTKGMENMCLPTYVEKYGLDNWESSLPAMAEFTRYSSSEFAIRPYIIKNLKKAMVYMLNLSFDDNEHVRRFSSEGCRPRLPWAVALPELKKDPSPIIPILENLKNDESEYVRKSVANNLNDISKDHPDLVLDICEKWQGHSKHTDWIIKRACRTMLKAGNPKAMQLFGYAKPDNLGINKLELAKKKITIGADLEFSFELLQKDNNEVKVRLEFAIDYLKANGKPSPKVFMIGEKNYSNGKHLISKKHSFKQRTTRKLYPGEHKLRLLVNGVEKNEIDFLLSE